MQNQNPAPFPRISRNIEDIRASIYTKINAVQDDFAQKGWLPCRLNLNKGVVRGLIELYAWGIWQVYNLMEKLLKQAIPQFAEDIWLDLHAESVGLKRKEATKANGKVRFIRRAGIAGNIIIAASRIIRTNADGQGMIYRYVTLANAVLPADADHVDVVAESEEYGALANAGTSQICEMITPINGIASVTNMSDWLLNEGANQENNNSLRRRIQLRWLSNNGCTKHAYMLWALSVPGVLSVEILDKHPRGQGTVGVVVRGTAVLPTEALLERVREAIKPEAPINDEWYVVSPMPVPVKITACLHYFNADSELIIAEAKNRILALFADISPYPEVTPLNIGQDLPLDLLTATVMDITGVKSVDWLSPTADTTIQNDAIAMLESLDLTTNEEAEA